MFKKFSFDYDYKNDSLFLYNSRSKSKASVEINDILIDFDKDKNVSGIEFVNASKFFNALDIDKSWTSKKGLRKISGCALNVSKGTDFLIIHIKIVLEKGNEISTPLILPMIEDQSPAVTV